MELDFNGFDKIEVMKIIDCLSILEEACEAKGVKFSKYDENQLLKILYMYRSYRLSGEPPF
jgi:hypothetical protein